MTKIRLSHLHIGILALVMCVSGYGCNRIEKIDERLDMAESFMESCPDSALFILNGIYEGDIKGSRSRSRFALLKSIALDKNRIDTTTFEVLQPAINYYLKSGNVDEKLRTYYYKGRIHENAGDYDKAMQSYLTALEISNDATDTLVLARLLIAQGSLYYREYRISEFSDNNLKAAELFGKLNMTIQQMRSYARALNGEVCMLNKKRADSIAYVCRLMIGNDSTLTEYARRPLLAHVVAFGQKEEILKSIENIQSAGIPNDMNMNLAIAYSKIGDPEKGLKYLNTAKIASDDILDSLTYWSVKAGIFENWGKYKEALEAFRNYSRVLEIYHDRIFSNELLFSEKKHEMEIENMAKIQNKDSIIKYVLVGVAILLLITVIIYYRYRINKAARLLAEKETEKLESESAQLRLEAENLHLQIGQLEDEQEQLKELLDRPDTLSEEARELIRERISMLNGLFAQALTEQESYGKEFKKYVQNIKKDKKGFQQSLVKVLETTHPEFMAYLREHDLTDRELNYCCLYAIGLRGKEIGNYLDLARHYNISSEVRRKLGLDSNGENLGPFIRKIMMGQGL